MMQDLQSTSISAKCGHCGKWSSLKVLAEYCDVDEFEADDGRYAGEMTYLLRLVRCSRCDSLNLTVEDEDGGETSVLWPH